MNSMIQIFAADHRKNVDWDLPFIRITDNDDSIISIKDDQYLYSNRDVLSELSRMIYAYQHLSDFGNPSYVGFCHYRRFFANIDADACQPYRPYWLETSDKSAKSKILSPLDQYSIISRFKVDGIIEHAFPEVSFPVDSINDWFKMLNRYLDYLQIPEQIIDFAISQFYENIDDSIKPFFKKAYAVMPIYHHNIFTVNLRTLDAIFKPMVKSIYSIIEFERSSLQFRNAKYSKRWLAYIIEYLYVNVLLHALQLSEKFKFLKCKILVLNA